jgi:hypothetical protein
MANVSEIKQAIQDFHQSGRRVKMRADFEDSIKQDYAHIEGLESLLAAKLAYFENEDWSQFSKWYMEMSHAELQVEVNDLKERILLQKKNLADKMKHFDEAFLPMYEERLILVKKEFDSLLKLAKAFVEEPLDGTETLKEKKRFERICFYLDDWNQLSDEERNDIEIQSNYHSVFVNLIPKLDALLQATERQ